MSAGERKPFLEAVRIMAAVAWADGTLGVEEAEQVRRMIEVGPLSPDERTFARGWLHGRPDETVARLELPVSGRADIFKTAVRVAAADGRVVKAESDLLARLQQALELDDATADQVRQEVKAEGAQAAPAFAKLYRIPVHTLRGELTSLGTWKGKALLLVNVASECGMTPQYEQLQKLHQTYGDRGLAVIGFPCNQFGGQEPGDAPAIEQFCTSHYGVTFPMMEKIEVKGPGQHDIYQVLTEVPDAEGKTGEVQWNFEKFLVAADATGVVRFRPQTVPDDPAVIAAIEAALPRKTR
jgi:glutathione peroxidase